MLSHQNLVSHGDAAKAISGHIAHLLKAHNYKKRRNGFNRRLESGLIHQLSLFLGPATSITHGTFYFHFGCYVPAAELYRKKFALEPPNWVADSSCCLRGMLPRSKEGGVHMLDINAFHNEPQKAEKYVMSALQILAEIKCPNDILAMTEDGVDGFFGETPLEITKCCIEIERCQRQAASSRLAKYLSSFVGNPHHVTHVAKWGLEIGLDLPK